MFNVAFIESDPVFLEKLQQTIQLQPRMRCLIAANSVESFFENFPKRGKLDILFSEIELPGKSGIAALPALVKRFPNAEIIILTHLEEPLLLFQALSAGATGYLLKDFHLLKLPSLIQDSMKGEALISSRMTRYLVDYFRPSLGNESSILNVKEVQLLRLFADGNSYQETAEVLNMSIDGVKYYVKRIYGKLGVNNKVDAIKVLI